MRTLLIGIVFTGIMASNALRAQTMFAPPGAEWYHSMLDSPIGVFHSYYAGDTILSGISCRRVMRIAEVGPFWSDLGLTVPNLFTLYFYNNSDTVFVYNYLFNRFTPLYVFNVTDGDTVRLPILPAEVNSFVGHPSLYPDSTFSFVVDSVRMVLYDTAFLKTVYTRLLGTCDSDYVYTYGDGDTLGAYAQQIGGISIGLSPQYMCGVNFLDESYQTQSALRCYNDPALSIKLVTDSCGLPPSTTVVTLKKQDAVTIFPNPANDLLHLSLKGGTTPCAYSLIDMYGRVAGTGIAENNTTVNVSQLPDGVYLLQIRNSGGELLYQKFVKK